MPILQNTRRSLLLGLICTAVVSAQEREPSPPIRHAFFVAGPTFTGIIDGYGNPQWAAPTARARDGWVLPNGHILIVWQERIVEFDRSKKAIWRRLLQKPNKEFGTVQRLPSGNTLVVELGPEPRLQEVSPKGEVVVQFALKPETGNAHMQTRMARKLPNGDYLVPHLLAHCVKQYTASGEVVATIRTDLEALGGRKAENWPFTAIRLANGNTLVGCTHGNKVCEFDPSGGLVWSVTNEDVGGRIRDACGVQRLPNGNTVIASYQAKKGAKLLEVDRDKNVVWTYEGKHRVHHFQILTTNGEPLPGVPLR